MDDSINRSHYVKTEYTGSVCLRNSETGEIIEKQIKRTVYQNSNINPDLFIPAGTTMGNETTYKDMTNLERMQSGKSPAVLTTDSKGNYVYDKIELHHLTSTECNKGGNFFNGVCRDGAIVEIQSSLHDKYQKQLHAINEKGNSFRKATISSVDKTGKTIRLKVKTVDSKQYEKFRAKYWKDRADAFIHQKQENSKRIECINSREGGDNMAKSWELTPEQKQKAIDGNKKAAAKYNKKSTTTSGTGETKGQRERERGKSRGQSR